MRYRQANPIRWLWTGLIQCAAAAGAAHAAPQYTVVDLGTGPAGINFAVAVGVCEPGVYGYGQASRFGVFHALLWTSEGAVDLTPAAFSSAEIVGGYGNSLIGIADNRAAGNWASHALLWTDPALPSMDLTPPEFLDAVVSGVWGDRQVGHGGRAGVGYHALMWSGDSTDYVDLNPPGYDHSGASDIWEQWQVGSASRAAAPPTHAMLWSGTPDSYVDPHPSGYEWSYASAVRDGQQVGVGQTSGGQQHALLWAGSAESVIDLQPPGFLHSGAEAVANGWQAGSGFISSNNHALAWHGSAETAIDLHQFLPGEYASSQAYGIDGQGRIYGYAYRADLDQMHAVYWVPVPEPISAAMVMIAACGLVIPRKRESRR
jgi:hypothetical protein